MRVAVDFETRGAGKSFGAGGADVAFLRGRVAGARGGGDVVVVMVVMVVLGEPGGGGGRCGVWD